MRSAVDFVTEAGGVSVYLSGEMAGELELTQPLESVLTAFLQLKNSKKVNESDILSYLELQGHRRDDILTVLDILLRAGLAVRYNHNIPDWMASHIADWTTHVNNAVVQIQESRVFFTGQTAPMEECFNVLSDWGIRPEPVSTDFFEVPSGTTAIPALIIAWIDDVGRFEQTVRWCAENGIPFLPVCAHGNRILVGPTFVQAVSPCPFCGSPNNLEMIPESVSTSCDTPSGWPRIAAIVADFLAGRPGIEEPFLQHVLDAGGRYRAGYAPMVAPRCPVCSRLNKFPENAVIHV